MSEYLELPELEGSAVSKGDPLPENQPRPNNTAEPLAPGVAIPGKTYAQLMVETANPDVVAAREEKERKKQQTHPVGKKKAATGPSQPKKRRRVLVEEEVVVSEKHTVDVNPINQAEPSERAGQENDGGQGLNHPVENAEEEYNSLEKSNTPPAQNDEGFQNNPPPTPSDAHSERQASRAHVQTGENQPLSEGHTDLTGGYFIPGWTLRDDVCMNSFRACREMMSHLATPAEEEALASLNNNQLVRQSYTNCGSGVVLQAEVLKRFSQLNRDHRELRATHDECESIADGLKDERDAHIAKFETLLKEFRMLEKEQQDERSAASIREKGLVDQLEEIEREKNEATSLSGCQASKIEELEKKLAEKSAETERLATENKSLTAQLAIAEVVRQNTVRELIPAAFRRLFQSAEYKRSLGKVYSLSYSGGFIDGVRTEREPEDAEKVLQKIKRLNMEAPKLWKPEYHKLFSAEYPYVQKLAESFQLPLGDQINLLPEEPVKKTTPSPAVVPPPPKVD